MLPPYDKQVPKKTTNLSINSELLGGDKELDINLFAALEQALTLLLKQRLQEQWLVENREAIEAYNQHSRSRNTAPLVTSTGVFNAVIHGL